MDRGVDPLWDHPVDTLSSIGEVSGRDPPGLTVTLDRADGVAQVVEIDMMLVPADTDWDRD